MTHRPANKYCKICRIAKTRHKRHQRRLKPLWDFIKKFGDVVTFDHFDSLDIGSQSMQGHCHGIVGLDIASGFLMNRPLITKTGTETAHELRMWRGTDRLTHCHSDGSGELAWVCKYEGISHDTSEPGDPQSNGVAEAYVGISKFGTRTNLRQAGLPHPYWHWAFAYHEVSWNTTSHVGRLDPVPWHARFGEEFKGMMIPFGALIHFVSAPGSRHAKDLRPFDSSATVGIFLGWVMDAGCKFKGGSTASLVLPTSTSFPC
jgi:hypothetical protein